MHSNKIGEIANVGRNARESGREDRKQHSKIEEVTKVPDESVQHPHSAAPYSVITIASVRLALAWALFVVQSLIN